ncbi:hypothetical protein JHW43_005443 [Diplocarpon mali]|nr:hypothetical protein JHW43_005443 [Diplocarpon mali]
MPGGTIAHPSLRIPSPASHFPVPKFPSSQVPGSSASGSFVLTTVTSVSVECIAVVPATRATSPLPVRHTRHTPQPHPRRHVEGKTPGTAPRKDFSLRSSVSQVTGCVALGNTTVANYRELADTSATASHRRGGGSEGASSLRMNTLFNTALKQSTSLKRDLSSPSNGQPLSPSFLGQISASLTSFSRTLDSYADLLKTELNPSKKEKAEERLRSFRAELQSFRAEFKELKLQNEDVQSRVNRQELLGRRPHHTATPDNPYSSASISANPSASSPWAPVNGSGQSTLGLQSGDPAREDHALREQNFFANTHTALDEYLARGQAVLGDLGQQREILKGTQKRLYSVANTLGVSGDTIRMIERRAKQDKWIFYAGAVTFFGFCYLVLWYLR